MFEQAVLSNGPASKRVWTTFAGITGQALLVTFAVMIPMIWPEAMPSHQSLLRVFMPGVPPGPPPKQPAAQPTHFVRAPLRQFNNGLFTPRHVPPHPMPIEEPPDVPIGPAGTGVIGSPGPGTGSRNGIFTGMFDGPATVLPPPPVTHPAPAAPAPEPVTKRYKEGGLVHLGEPIHRVEPSYPPLARTAHVSGIVQLEAVVGVDGRIRELKLKSGHPLLAPAAMEAVRQWVYTPTTLNSEPVELIAVITVTFRMN